MSKLFLGLLFTTGISAAMDQPQAPNVHKEAESPASYVIAGASLMSLGLFFGHIRGHIRQRSDSTGFRSSSKR